jgi:large subunit ribosomal protein L18
MAMNVSERRRRARRLRHARVRKGLSGSTARPRLAVFRSLQHIYAQVIDDLAGHTLAAASTRDPLLAAEVSGRPKREQAAAVGRAVAERARSAGVEAVVFDRGGYNYHGRVRSLAEAAREAGLKF